MSEIFERTDNFKRIPIAKRCVSRMKDYARLAGGSEIYGFLLSNKKSDGIVRDIILATGQYASSASAGLSGEGIIQTKEEIEKKGLKAIGFWHSHGNFSVFHSGTDDHNMEKLLLSLSGNNEEKTNNVPEKYWVYDSINSSLIYRAKGEEFIIKLRKNQEIRIRPAPRSIKMRSERVVLLKDKTLVAKDGDCTFIIPGVIGVERKEYSPSPIKSTGAAYSIVTNRRGDLYAELGLVNWCYSCSKEEVSMTKNIPLYPLNVKDFLEEKNDKQLSRDLLERVNSHHKNVGTSGRLLGRL